MILNVDKKLKNKLQIKKPKQKLKESSLSKNNKQLPTRRQLLMSTVSCHQKFI